MTILIISSACCNPSMAVFDEQAKKVAEQAIRETGVNAEVKIIPGATAIYGGVIPRPLVNQLMARFSRNQQGPAVVIDGEIISYGVPQLENVKAKLQSNKY